ncbi:Nucleic-acid-binding protein from transposon X-element [Eumeta japonica]|uniref:Nucleic-acid-binding protein from transposon X-element n=1 Tax=Eumeta variegata TaxID=151549 RepID=A0A4C2A466_EUMVA|nr:Nucleic-acid-binding protein from transposon X-element [Eumeta japonica]
MEINPLLLQAGGRPPNNLIGKSTKTKEKISEHADEKGVSKCSLEQSVTECQTNEKKQLKSMDAVGILEDIKISDTDMAEASAHNEDQDAWSLSSLNSEFNMVKNKKRKFPGDVVIDLEKNKFSGGCKASEPVNNNNRFSLLGDLNLVEDVPPNDTAVIRNRETNCTQNTQTQTQHSARNSYCPPIIMENVNVRSLVGQLKSKNVQFKIKNKSQYKSKLYFKELSAHLEMVELLKQKQISAHSFTPRELKRQSVICRGLYFKSDINEIKMELDSLIPDTIESVSKFATELSRKKGVDTGLFLVVLKPGRKASELLGLKVILNQVVSWERPKSSKKIPQCWRCQQWGHYSKNCSRPFACLKCDQKHGPGECAFVSDGFSGEYSGLVLGGDLNAKNVLWGDAVNNFNGEVLSSWLQNEAFSVTRICDVLPTYPGGSSHLDHFIVSNDLLEDYQPNYRTRTLPTFSDHYPLALTMSLSSFNIILRTPDHFISYKNTDWNAFKSNMISAIMNHYPPGNRNLSNNEIDLFLDSFSTSVNFATAIHSVRVESRNRKFIASDKLRKMLKVKYSWQKELKRIFASTYNRLHPQYLLLSKQIELMKILIRQQIEKEQAIFFDNRVKRIRPGPWAYKEIFKMIGRKSRSSVRNISLDGVTITDDNEKVQILKNYFGSLFQNVPPNRDVIRVKETINEAVLQASCEEFSDNDTSLNELGEIEIYKFELCVGHS